MGLLPQGGVAPATLPVFLLLLLLLLSSTRGEPPDLRGQEEAEPEPAKCEVDKSWTQKGIFPPNRTEFRVHETASVFCPEQKGPVPYEIVCVAHGDGAAWDLSRVPCLQPAKCEVDKSWTRKGIFPPNRAGFRVHETASVFCPEQKGPVPYEIVCVAHGDGAAWDLSRVPCLQPAKCEVDKSWTRKGIFPPNRAGFRVHETASVFCPKQKGPVPYEIVCVAHGDGAAWDLSRVPCLQCQVPKDWDRRLEWAPRARSFAPGESVRLTCTGEGYQAVPEEIRCVEKPGGLDWDARSVCQGFCSRARWPPWVSAADSFRKETFAVGEFVWVTCRPERYGPRREKIWCREKDGHTWWDTSRINCIEKPRIIKENLQVSSTSITLAWNCSAPGSCQGWRFRGTCQLSKSSQKSCKRTRKWGWKPLTQNTLHCQDLHSFSSYHIRVNGSYSAGPYSTLYEEELMTKEGVPDQPERESLDLSSRVPRWRPPSSCNGLIVGYQVNVTATRAYNASFREEEQLRVNASVREYRRDSWRPGTNYTVTVQALTAAGPGKELSWALETGISEPFVPPRVKALAIYNISALTRTAVLPLEPLPDLHGPIREYQLFVTPPESARNASSCRSLELRPFNPDLEDNQTYVAAVLPAHNLTWPMDFVIGDGRDWHGFYNAPLCPGRSYTVLLRVVSRWNQEETSSCVRYDFSLGEAPGAHGGLPVPLLVTSVSLGLVGLLLLLLLGLLVARKKWTKVEGPRGHGAVPLQRRRGAASKLHTQIPVAELLEVLKRYKRAEMEAAVKDEEEDEGDLKTPAAGRDAEFQKLVSGLLHPCLAGKEPHNLPKNRYKSILPYDESRVVLQTSDSTADYINASYVDSYQSPKFFIAAQGPLSGTVPDFWRMVWQEKTLVIVMLTELVEQNKPKCGQYWPSGGREEYGDITVALSSTRATPGLVTRTFSLKKAGTVLPRKVEQFQFLQWPDHGLPRNPAGLLRLLESVNRRASEAPAAGPVVVHCSAGVGRTGTFIALDCLLKMGRSEGLVDVFRCVQRLREQRTSMVQTKAQYAFLYEVLLEGLLCGNTGVPVEQVPSHTCRLKAPSGQGHGDGYTQEFQALERLSELSRLSPRTEALKPCNRAKNRSPEILPADHSRPLLMSSLKPDGTPGYINATFVDGYAKEDRFITTQLPLQETLVDFWALVWDYACTALVLLDSPAELDQTCPEFWPSSSKSTYGPFVVTLSSEEPRKGYIRRVLTVASSQQAEAPPLEIWFWQLQDWPGAQQRPGRPGALLRLSGDVEEEQRRRPGNPVLVTCRDGAARCGVFCALSFVCEQIRAEGLLDVSQAVRMLKRRQPHFVRDVEQYRLCYHLALCYLDSSRPSGASAGGFQQQLTPASGTSHGRLLSASGPGLAS